MTGKVMKTSWSNSVGSRNPDIIFAQLLTKLLDK